MNTFAQEHTAREGQGFSVRVFSCYAVPVVVGAVFRPWVQGIFKHPVPVLPKASSCNCGMSLTTCNLIGFFLPRVNTEGGTRSRGMRRGLGKDPEAESGLFVPRVGMAWASAQACGWS